MKITIQGREFNIRSKNFPSIVQYRMDRAIMASYEQYPHWTVKDRLDHALQIAWVSLVGEGTVVKCGKHGWVASVTSVTKQCRACYYSKKASEKYHRDKNKHPDRT